MPVFADVKPPNRSRYDTKTPPGLPINTRTGIGAGGAPPRTGRAFDPDYGSTDLTTDQQAIEFILSQGGNPYPDLSSQHPEEMGAGSDQMEAALRGEKYIPDSGATKPEPEKPKPEKPKPKPIKTHPTPSKMISSAGWIADLMTQMGFAPEETAEISTSRYPRQEAAVPELGLRGQPDDQWMGLLSALLEEKKRKEARSMA